MDALAITLAGFKFSGTFALEAVLVIAIVVVLAWFAMRRRQRR